MTATLAESGITQVTDKLVYAGFWRRLFATLIDFVLLLTLLLPVYLLVNGLPLSMSFITNHWAFNLTWFISLIVFWTTIGASPGKRLLNCKIVKINPDNSISDLDLRSAVLRALAYIISAIPIYLGFVWIAFDKNKRAVHDLIVKTAVIIDDENYEKRSIQSLMALFPK
ncbi:hypothetical protein MNBD_GAMMA22-2382 [hydrothermal vent metagenome]|uniref:RDD domain-containing protein n=1 Tax=hydrothermal vent metagenome TaxID=652676 RepID=A0A3B0ZVN5_9ZZZZ